MPPRARKKSLPKKKVSPKPKREIPEHDKSYKKLFSHPKMIQEGRKGFVAEPWVEQVFWFPRAGVGTRWGRAGIPFFAYHFAVASALHSHAGAWERENPTYMTT